MKKSLLKNNGVQSLIASLLCIVLGMLIGYIVLLFINPTGAGEAIITVMKNFLNYNRADTQLKYLGNTLVKTAPLLMCALSILFAYKVGLFNIGASGQYTAGACAALYAALQWHWSWLPCMLLAIAAGCVMGAIVGLLKAYCNVNEVISGIMLNWIMLYTANMILANVKEPTSPYTIQMRSFGSAAVLPTLGLDKLFNDNTCGGRGTEQDPLRLRAAGHRQQQVCRQVLRHGGKAQHHPDAGDRRRTVRLGRLSAVPERL